LCLEAVVFRVAEVPWSDPIAIRLLVDAEAVAAGKAEWIPLYGPLSPEAEHAVALAVRDCDRMAERLRTEKPTPS
jgi:hypothetical protein